MGENREEVKEDRPSNRGRRETSMGSEGTEKSNVRLPPRQRTSKESDKDFTRRE